MNKNRWRLLVSVVVLAFLVPIVYGYLHSKNFAVFNPKGSVAVQERDLMVLTILLGLAVIIPVYIMLFAFAWRYREGNKKAKYSPNLSGNVIAETVWWGIPLVIIGMLSVITWHTSHSLDPHKPLSNVKPLHVQVIALNWKWLFIYPEQGIASVNDLNLPTNQPISFEITADAPMNSFWIPQLGSQIYAMPGMSTHLNLVANETGHYRGSSANISGKGFADMVFSVYARPSDDFKEWVSAVKDSGGKLDSTAYQDLARPGTHIVTNYARVEPELYHRIMLKYLAPGGSYVR